MKFSLKERIRYDKNNVSSVFCDSDEEMEVSYKPKKPNKRRDNTERIGLHRQTGIRLAELGELESSLESFENAIKLSTRDSSIFEMKSQIHLKRNQIFTAIKEAHKSIELSPNWGTGYQTLARAQLGYGELELALKNFQKCLHYEPDNTEVREEDLPWCLELLEQKQILDSGIKLQSEMAIELKSDL